MRSCSSTRRSIAFRAYIRTGRKSASSTRSCKLIVLEGWWMLLRACHWEIEVRKAVADGVEH